MAWGQCLWAPLRETKFSTAQGREVADTVTVSSIVAMQALDNRSERAGVHGSAGQES